ncbi:MFS transporter [Pseudooceanicola sp. CBS1P-1]|uniref:MFS transporter n=2 Tax=Paracoccaceae TaxID=31989 RepID=A0A6L7G8P2_9RHOB|nr:MFS transporter [Pseudooceanicola endophyticus]MXN19043.1 MFS transporter [Pseudooceanicola albus]
MSDDATAARRGLIMLALALGGFAIGVAEFATMSILPYFARDYGVGEAPAGHAISAYALGVCIGAPILALLGARVSRRALLVALMSFYAVANGLSILAPTWGTFVATRFLAGLPHGAYFGVAALMAASMYERGKRSQAVSRVMMGLTVATILGVPMANIFGAQIGWRWSFVLVVALAAGCALTVRALAPQLPAPANASPLNELSALKSRQIWLTLLIGAIGTGGMFAVYTYVASTMMLHFHAPETAAPIMLMIFGIGMTLGQMVCGWGADKSVTGATGITLACSAVLLVGYWFAVDIYSMWLTAAALFAIGLTGGLSTILQMRLMDLGGEAPTLAVALNHSAFNVANALGPFLGGMALSMGAGWPTMGLVGAGLSVAGILVWIVAVVDDAPSRRGMMPT